MTIQQTNRIFETAMFTGKAGFQGLEIISQGVEIFVGV